MGPSMLANCMLASSSVSYDDQRHPLGASGTGSRSMAKRFSAGSSDAAVTGYEAPRGSMEVGGRRLGRDGGGAKPHRKCTRNVSPGLRGYTGRNVNVTDTPPEGPDISSATAAATYKCRKAAKMNAACRPSTSRILVLVRHGIAEGTYSDRETRHSVLFSRLMLKEGGGRRNGAHLSWFIRVLVLPPRFCCVCFCRFLLLTSFELCDTANHHSPTEVM